MRNFLSINDSILIVLPRFIERGFAISGDIRCGETFNIIPSRVRMVENSARPPGIAKDGSGLAATLYSMVKKEPEYKRKMFLYRTHAQRPHFRSTRTIKDLINYVKLANSSISDIHPYNDPFENQLKLVFTIKDGDYEAFLPMSIMSDGTLKWITLITAVMTSESLFSVEEPENYLHPQMQSEILSIMRTSIKEKESFSCIIMTTHSETLLNSARPEEIIVTHFENGCTIASRPKNKDIINTEIKKTGFGLGYYYLAGALEDA
jgi:predicted ATP-dependent endonuclease of OLD family